MRRSIRALCAAGAMFTRLPFWRLVRLEREDYQYALAWWSVVGLITGGVMVGVFVLMQCVLPIPIAIVLALAARLMLTGGFHEDGLGDFFDGFGGGGSRERILAIMKDSHVGSYAVLGYIFYYGLLWLAYTELARGSTSLICGVMLYSDVLGKWVSSCQVQWLPYARDEKTSKTGIVYRKSPFLPNILSVVMILWLPHLLNLTSMWFAMMVVSFLVGTGLIGYIWRKIGGYTGDTCGAICLLAELSAVLSALALYSLT